MSIEKKEAIYNISTHGILPSSVNSESDKPITNYYTCDIPNNVELYTYTAIGVDLICWDNAFTAQDFICRPKRQSLGINKVIRVQEPRYKCIGPSKFPNIFLYPELDDSKRFYSGITYCNKNNPIEDKSEVIYNIDAKKSDDCDCTTIAILKDKQKTQEENNPYNCDKKYSQFYKDLLKKTPQTCGPILLEEAIKLILEHSKLINDGMEVTIKIYLHSCLSIKNVSEEVQEYIDGKLTHHSRLTDLPPLYQSNNKSIRLGINFTESIRLGTDTVKKLIDSNNTVTEEVLSKLTILIPTSEKTFKFMFNNTLFIVNIANIYKDLKISKSSQTSKMFDYTRQILGNNPLWYVMMQLQHLINTYLTQHGVTSNFFPPIIILNITSAQPYDAAPEITEQLNTILEPLRLSKHEQPIGFIKVVGGRHKDKIRHTYKKTLRKKYKKPKKTKHIKNFTKKHKSKNRKY